MFSCVCMFACVVYAYVCMCVCVWGGVRDELI